MPDMTETAISSREVTRTSGSNFVSSFWFLPKEKRDALTRIYAFCRITDDIVDMADQTGDQADARAKITDWRAETARALGGGDPGHAVLKELAPVADRYKIPQNLFYELIDGVSMDLDRKSYATFDELHSYCYKVASVVGLMCLEVFGYKDPVSKKFAVDLGLAFQLTNILRDVKTDAQRGRTYLPDEDLRRFDLARGDLLALANADGFGAKAGSFHALFAFETARAVNYYESAKAHLPPSDRPNMAAAEVMSAVYFTILNKIQKNPDLILRRKVSLSKPEAILRVFQGWLTNKWGL